MRFLLVTNAHWVRELGVSHVLIELAAALREMGHHVEKFSYEEAFPEGTTGRWIARLGHAGHLVTGTLPWRDFSRRARRFVRQRAGDFDVIDAGLSDLPYTKAALGFSGLLVARVPFLVPTYEQFALEERRRWPMPRDLRDRFRDALGAPRRRRVRARWLLSARRADLINVSSRDDEAILRSEYGLATTERFVLGLTGENAAALRAGALPTAERQARQTVVFVGTWNARKGVRDWPLIVARTLRSRPGTRFLFLGTGLRVADVLADFPPEHRHLLLARPSFAAAELPSLLGSATVGAFPGYLEGFGLGVLEMLAAGLPVVGYDAPGTRDMLGQVTTLRTTRAGDVDGFADQLVRVLSLERETYEAMSAESLRVSEGYRWTEIARQTATSYEARLRALRGAGASASTRPSSPPVRGAAISGAKDSPAIQPPPTTGYLLDPSTVMPRLLRSQLGCYRALDSAATRHAGDRLALDPAKADFVLVAVEHAAGQFFRHFKETPFYREFGDKCYGYSTEDRSFPSLPGLYTSARRVWVDAGWARGAPYVSDEIPLLHFRDEEIGSAGRDLLFSFVGASRNHPLRPRILGLRHPRALLADADVAGDPRAWWERPDAAAARDRFRAALARSKFVLCPRGVSPSSIRLFEAMEAGCVPVILADGLSLPPGPRWQDLSISVAERDWRAIPGLLEAREKDWESMGRAARDAWVANFSQANIWRYLVDQIASLHQDLGPATRRRIERKIRRWESGVGGRLREVGYRLDVRLAGWKA